MAAPYLARRSVSPWIAFLVVLACLVAAVPAGAAGAGSRLADLKRPRPRRDASRSSRAARSALWRCRRAGSSSSRPTRRTTGSRSIRVQNNGLEHRVSIPVGLEPVAVAARNDDEIWVVNHLSDSVSVVQMTQGGHSGRVVRTLLVGDEPRDIVFGGPGKNRAFITTAHRGQNVPYDPQLTTPGVGRADVWVFDANNLGAHAHRHAAHHRHPVQRHAARPGGEPGRQQGLRGGVPFRKPHHDHPRDPGPDGGEAAGGLPGPNTNADGVPRPEVGLIVKFNGTHWVDELNRVWDDQVRFSLPDKDVFVINANANPPAQLGGNAGFYRASAPSSTTWW